MVRMIASISRIETVIRQAKCGKEIDRGFGDFFEQNRPRT